MRHPLLEKILRDAASPAGTSREIGEIMADYIPPDIADRLEWALGECQWADGECLEQAAHRRHDERHAEEHDPKWSCHPYQPLVTP